MKGLSVCLAAVAGIAQAHTETVDRPQRLSEWLLKQPASADADLLALSWRSTAEVAAQAARKAALIETLHNTAPDLAQAMARLPATGRVLLPKVDARWLQANPAADPVLQPGDSVDLPPRSEWVAVLPSNGLLCLARYEPDLALANYLRACGQQNTRERAWLVQPDGQVFNYGERRWNREAQLPPAPGAWIWAPQADSPVTAAQSENLARFLATQGPVSSATQLATLERRETHTRERADQQRDLPVTTNDWGVIGLWQTPTARLDKAGSASATFSHAIPYNNLTVTLQPTDWLAGSVRYTDVLDLPYLPVGPARVSSGLGGDQSYKDKSTDVKIRLWKESDWLPQVALGWRDILGTGAFSGEYVVASKRAGDFDASLGLGFGYLGARGDISNPLGLLTARFNQRGVRKQGSGTGGEFNPRVYFRGPAAVFGGIQYHTPWDNLIVKVEYEGNDYKHEYLGLKVKARTPFNFGLTWRYRPWLDLSMGVERGNAVVLAFSAHTQLDGMNTPKVLDARPLTVTATRPAAGADPGVTTQEIERQTDLRIAAIERQGTTMTAVAVNPYLGYAHPAVDRALAVLHRDAPPEIDELVVRFEQRGSQLGQVVVNRDTWSKGKTQLLPDSQRPAPLQLNAVPTQSAQAATAVHDNRPGPLSYGVSLSYRQNLGGPDAFLLYQLAADFQGAWRMRDDTWLDGVYRVALLDNYDRFRYTAPSKLPRVRTHLREYSVASRDTIPNLQLTHMGQLGRNHFYLGYAGLLESMFAGVGGEYLYRPVNSRLAFGVDVNMVRQRNFDQKFGLRDYQVNTGHASLYWDTGFADILAKASVGQYLAGDRGATLDLSKVFGNGVVIGVYATKTNISAVQFGEGSFDKGLYVQIPFDAMLPKSGPSSALIAYNPLIRDGGARLNRRYDLYDLTSLRDRRAMSVGNSTGR